ncbi:MAG: hypothetical protein KAG66_24080, partial [Methylococcales bacterium]|nr:hypothetical protein [Methylococcales bacterium]
MITGPEFQVNSTALLQQTLPAVTALTGGGFIVTWTDSSNLSGTDTSGLGVYGQLFDTGGASVGSEFQVNTEITSTQNDSQVAALNDGGFVVTWTSQTSGTAGDGSGLGVFGQRYDASGATVNAEFQVNTEFTSTQNDSSVAGLSDGGFIVSWTSTSSGTAGDGSANGVFAQRYDNTGVKAGLEFQVNTETANAQDESAVTGLAGGGFVIAWTSTGQDGSADGVYAQRFDAVGNAVDAEFRVNESTVNSQFDATITALSDGGFVIAWTDNGSLDGSGHGVFGQQYDNNGNRVDEQFQVNTEFSSNQDESTVAALSNGNFVVAWRSET